MNKICDGDLYKVVSVFGATFEIYYGYYDEKERFSKYSDPIPIYPDFIKEPRYTSDGYPFTTEMQDVCPYFFGKEGEDSCFACSHFKKGDELIGICLCKKKMKIDL